MTNRSEAAAQIVLELEGNEIVVRDFDFETEIEVKRNFGSGKVVPDTYSVTKIEHGGSTLLTGNMLYLGSLLFDDEGYPVPGVLTITHMDGSTTTFEEFIVVSEGFQFSEAENSETSYNWIAMRKRHNPVKNVN